MPSIPCWPLLLIDIPLFDEPSRASLFLVGKAYNPADVKLRGYDKKGGLLYASGAR